VGLIRCGSASKWNFVNFQGPNISAVMMEFTTPPSYGSGVVNVSGISNDTTIIVASAGGESSFPTMKRDEEVDWDEPTTLKYIWRGKNAEGKEVMATLDALSGPRLDRVDVLNEVPAFVKKIVSGAAGTRPYIYQVSLALPCGAIENWTNMGGCEVFGEAQVED